MDRVVSQSVSQSVEYVSISHQSGLRYYAEPMKLHFIKGK